MRGSRERCTRARGLFAKNRLNRFFVYQRSSHWVVYMLRAVGTREGSCRCPSPFVLLLLLLLFVLFLSLCSAPVRGQEHVAQRPCLLVRLLPKGGQAHLVVCKRVEVAGGVLGLGRTPRKGPELTVPAGLGASPLHLGNVLVLDVRVVVWEGLQDALPPPAPPAAAADRGSHQNHEDSRARAGHDLEREPEQHPVVLFHDQWRWRRRGRRRRRWRRRWWRRRWRLWLWRQVGRHGDHLEVQDVGGRVQAGGRQAVRSQDVQVVRPQDGNVRGAVTLSPRGLRVPVQGVRFIWAGGPLHSGPQPRGRVVLPQQQLQVRGLLGPQGDFGVAPEALEAAVKVNQVHL